MLLALGLVLSLSVFGTFSRAENLVVDFADAIGPGPRYYGVEYSWIDQDAALFLNRYKRLHGNVVRIQITQDFFEPVDSRMDFRRTVLLDRARGKTMTYERMFKSLVTELPGLAFQINIWLCAKWNATDPNGYLGLGGTFPPRDYAKHREFIRAFAKWLVSSCGIPPAQLTFTFVNEPNLRTFFVGTVPDLRKMAEETREALDQVSPLIKMGGLDEVHGVDWTASFYALRPQRCCDLWSFHAYETGVPELWSALSDRIVYLKQFGPVWVTEFADISNGSPDGRMDFSTREAGLGFADLLGRLWASGIDGVTHFRLSDNYSDSFGGWVGHGLFANWRGTHAGGFAYKPFPAYFVFANVYREMGGGEIIRTGQIRGLTITGVRHNGGVGRKLSVLITNRGDASKAIAFRIRNFPAGRAQVKTFNILSSDTSTSTKTIKGDELALRIQVPRKSSYLYVFYPIRK